MDVLISVDMEGVAGIATVQQVHPEGRDYQSARALMTAEANAAVAGAFEGGATTVVVADSHGPMDNLIGEQLDKRAEYVIGSSGPLDMVQELTSRTGVLLFVGYHAGAGDPAGVLAHTFDGIRFADVRINGHSVNEAEVNGLVAASEGVPVGLITGDDVTCSAGETTFPDVIAVPVKTPLGSTASRSKHPAVAREAIAAGARRAVARAADGAIAPLAVPGDLIVEVDLLRLGAAEAAARLPGSVRAGVGTLRYKAAHPREVIDVLTVWSILASHHPRQ
jgi:D-amino peptidase